MDCPGRPDLVVTMNVRLRGQVVHGDKRGRKLGFPTANVRLARGAVLPPDGVYSCVIQIEGHAGRFGATTSIGNNPTFDDVRVRRVEAHVHDFDADLYGRKVELRLLGKLRRMQRFADVDELIRQTITDVAQSRELIAAAFRQGVST